jgi:hypothetical protein
MRGLVTVLVVLLASGGIYYVYIKNMPTSAEGTAATQNISITGVKMDLTQIASAERSYIAEHNECGSMEQLLSSGAMTMAKSGRDGYTYAVECSGTRFTVRAQHAPAPDGSPIRYPNYVVDQTAEVREAN